MRGTLKARWIALRAGRNSTPVPEAISARRRTSSGAVVDAAATDDRRDERRSRYEYAYMYRLAAALIVALTCGGALAMAAQGWRIDETRTAIGFTIDATGFPTTRGRFRNYTGRIAIDLERLTESATSFTIDSASVDLGSEPYNAFVKSAALLDVARFPTLSFASTQVERIDPRTARVTGNLTMRGVTKPIALDVTIEPDPSAGKSAGRQPIAFSARGTIRRSDFGMTVGLPLIHDAIEITVKTRALTDE
jgi:polyisoprenoid-binding protein YceI